jgi:hypothetical protein
LLWIALERLHILHEVDESQTVFLATETRIAEIYKKLIHALAFNTPSMPLP